jgi:hypothetical protein
LTETVRFVVSKVCPLVRPEVKALSHVPGGVIDTVVVNVGVPKQA